MTKAVAREPVSMMRSSALLMAAALREGKEALRLTEGDGDKLSPDRPEDPGNRRVEIRDLGSAN